MSHLLLAGSWTSVQQFGNLLGSLWPYAAILAGFFGLLARSFKKTVHEMVTNEIRPIQEQFKNNGGSSMKDAVDRIEANLDVTNERVAAQAETLVRHTDSDAENFDSIITTLLKIIEGQAGAKATALNVQEALTNHAIVVKQDLDDSAAHVREDLVSDAATVKKAVADRDTEHGRG